MQVIGLLVPDPTILGKELRVQKGARQTREDGKKSRDKNRDLPCETYPFSGSYGFNDAHGPCR